MHIHCPLIPERRPLLSMVGRFLEGVGAATMVHSWSWRAGGAAMAVVGGRLAHCSSATATIPRTSTWLSSPNRGGYRGSVAIPTEAFIAAGSSAALGIIFCCCVGFLSSASQAVAARQILSSVAMGSDPGVLRLNLASCSGCNGDTHILTFAARSWRYWRRRSRERANLSVSRPLRRPLVPF